jgi:O-antigen/teichoic acid export membrane protein
VLSVLGCIFLAIFGLPIYGLWTHNELNPPAAMWYLFLIGILFNAVWWTAGATFRAMNKPYPLAISGIISAVVAIICSYVFCLLWGLVGAAMGCLIFEIIMAVYVLPVSCKLMQIPVKTLFDNRFIKSTYNEVVKTICIKYAVLHKKTLLLCKKNKSNIN